MLMHAGVFLLEKDRRRTQPSCHLHCKVVERKLYVMTRRRRKMLVGTSDLAGWPVRVSEIRDYRAACKGVSGFSFGVNRRQPTNRLGAGAPVCLVKACPWSFPRCASSRTLHLINTRQLCVSRDMQMQSSECKIKQGQANFLYTRLLTHHVPVRVFLVDSSVTNCPKIAHRRFSTKWCLGRTGLFRQNDY